MDTNSLKANKILFLDRDGTVNKEADYLSDPEEVELLPGVASVISRAHEAGYKVVVVSNQSGIGRGYFTEETLSGIHSRLNDLLKKENTFLDGIYYCPHVEADQCTCRKPQPGMLLRAAEEFNGDLKHSIMVGDKNSDIGAGKNAGCITVLVRTGYGVQTEKENRHGADHVVDSLADIDFLLK